MSGGYCVVNIWKRQSFFTLTLLPCSVELGTDILILHNLSARVQCWGGYYLLCSVASALARLSRGSLFLFFSRTALILAIRLPISVLASHAVRFQRTCTARLRQAIPKRHVPAANLPAWWRSLQRRMESARCQPAGLMCGQAGPSRSWIRRRHNNIEEHNLAAFVTQPRVNFKLPAMPSVPIETWNEIGFRIIPALEFCSAFEIRRDNRQLITNSDQEAWSSHAARLWSIASRRHYVCMLGAIGALLLACQLSSSMIIDLIASASRALLWMMAINSESHMRRQRHQWNPLARRDGGLHPSSTMRLITTAQWFIIHNYNHRARLGALEIYHDIISIRAQDARAVPLTIPCRCYVPEYHACVRIGTQTPCTALCRAAGMSHAASDQIHEHVVQNASTAYRRHGTGSSCKFQAILVITSDQHPYRQYIVCRIYHCVHCAVIATSTWALLAAVLVALVLGST